MPWPLGSSFERFRATMGARLLARGWTPDPDGPPSEGSFFGSFRKDVAPGFVATAELILESGPGFSWPASRRIAGVTIGGEVGVRHEAAARRLREFGLRCDTNTCLDIKEIFEAEGRSLPRVADDPSAEAAAEILAEVVQRVGEPFAAAHSSLEAMVESVRAGHQTTRDELFAAIFVPVALDLAGQPAERDAAIATHRARLGLAADRAAYEALVPRFVARA